MITGYGAMVALGLLSAGALACWLGRRFFLDVNDIILLSTYTVAFGISGAKILYLALNFSLIDWPHFFEWEYFRALMGGGFVFYGGVPAGIAGLYLAGRLHHIRVIDYLRACLPSLPLVHGFGRIGCALAGCCYGIPYSGPFALTYHNSIAAPTVFPSSPFSCWKPAQNSLSALCCCIWS
ncbi:prolipoprotein diacylglyceryl transferase family protein [Oscillospiraceae bacterium 50-58]